MKMANIAECNYGVDKNKPPRQNNAKAPPEKHMLQVEGREHRNVYGTMPYNTPEQQIATVQSPKQIPRPQRLAYCTIIDSHTESVHSTVPSTDMMRSSSILATLVQRDSRIREPG